MEVAVIYCRICRGNRPVSRACCAGCGTPVRQCKSQPIVKAELKALGCCRQCNSRNISRTTAGSLVCESCGSNHVEAFTNANAANSAGRTGPTNR